MGLVGRRLAGERTRPLAAGIAAIYAPLVINDSVLMSESLYGLLIALVLLAALRYRDNPGPTAALVLGVAIGLAALTRSEALLLVLLLAPLVLRSPGGRRARDLALVALAVFACALPWALRNSFTFDEPVLLTTGDGSVFAAANLPTTYSGPLMGAWNAGALFETPAGRTAVRNEAVQSRRWRKEGLDYAADHATRVPAVVAVRIMRTWSIYPLTPSRRRASRPTPTSTWRPSSTWASCA